MTAVSWGARTAGDRGRDQRADGCERRQPTDRPQVNQRLVDEFGLETFVPSSPEDAGISIGAVWQVPAYSQPPDGRVWELAADVFANE